MKSEKTERTIKRKDFLKKSVANILTCALCITSVFSMAAPITADAASTTPRFKDISKHWGEAAITKAADMGMVKGNNNGKYNPDSNLSRAELVSIINNIFGATEKADLSEFYDVNPKKWYYENLQIAYFMETIWGKAGGRLGPDDSVTREDAIVGIARAFELSSDNTSVLNKFADGTAVSEDAKKSVAAMISAGYINGFPVKSAKTPTYNIKPNSYLTRAEIAAIITNMISEVYIPGKNYTGRIIGECMVVNEPNTYISGITVNGDLVIGDGVGYAGAIIENSTIKGRLVVRGGGEYSVYLSDTVVEGGTVVNSPSVGVRLVGEGNASAGIVTAKTSTILDGNGFISLQVPNTAREGSTFNIQNTQMDSIDINAPRTAVNLASGAEVTNMRFAGKAGGSILSMARSSSLEFLGVSAANVSVTGTGSIGEAQINAGGFSSDFTPSKYNIANNISATINGRNRSGGSYSGAGQNEVMRNDSDMNVSAKVNSYDDFTSTMISSSTINSAYLTAKGSVQVPFILGDVNTTNRDKNDYFNERYAYWIEVDVPAPSGYSSTVEVKHSIDGQIKSYSYNVRGGDLQLFVPATKSTSEAKGSINQRFYIDWGSDDEVLDIKGSNIQLKDLSREEQNMLIDQFKEAIFTGCDGTNYEGSEAIRRMLLTDNPLGLDLRGYKSYDEVDQNYIAVKLYANRNSITTKSDIQKLLILETSRKGALYLVNNATKGIEIRDILDDDIYAGELTVDTSADSKYASLSERGKIALGNAIITARKKDFADAAAFKTAYDKALETVLKTETALLTALNSAANPAALQKVYETAANAAYLGLAISSEPYTLFPPAQKSGIAASAYAALPFADLDEARAILVALIGVDVDPTLVVVDVSSVSMDSSSATIVKGQDYVANASLKLSSGEIVPVDTSNAIWAVDKMSIADVDSTGTIEGLGIGSAKVTVTSTVNNKKSASMTVKVVAPVAATGISLNKSEMQMEIGNNANLVATLTPSTSNDTVQWGSEDSSIAMVDNMGRVNGMSKGITSISARVSGVDQIAFCSVIVLPITDDILINMEEATIGVGGELQLKAYVAPLTAKDKSVKWSTSDKDVVTVDNGRIKGVSKGDAVITVQSAKGMKAYCNVTVDDRSGITLDRTSLTIYPNGIDRLVATISPAPTGTDRATWYVEEGGTEYVRVSPNPNVTNGAIVQGLKPGTAYVVATFAQKDGTSVNARCLVTVPSTKLTIQLTTAGKQAQSITNAPGNYLDPNLLVSFNPATVSNKNINWTTGNRDIIEVRDGYVYPVAPGSGAKLTGVPEADSTQILTITINVVEVPVTEINVSQAHKHIYLDVGETMILDYSLVGANNQPPTNQEVSWAVSTNKVSLGIDGNRAAKSNKNVPLVILANDTTLTEGTTKTAINSSGEAIEYFEPGVDVPITLTGTPAGNTKISASVLITVNPNPGATIINVNLSIQNWVMRVGEKMPLGSAVEFNLNEKGEPLKDPSGKEIKPSNRNVTWSVGGDNEVIKIDDMGNLEAVGVGEANITVTARNLKSDTKKIVVLPEAITGYDVRSNLNTNSTSGDWMQIDAGKTADGSVIIKPVSAATKLDYTAVDVDTNRNPIAGSNNIARIDSEGVIAALRPGWAKITVTTPNDYAAYNSMIKPSDPNVNYARSLVTTRAGISGAGIGYYGPNYPYSIMTLGQDYMKLEDRLYPLGVNNNVAPRVYYVWVKPVQISTVSIVQTGTQNNSGSVIKGNKMSLSAVLTPVGASITTAGITWTVKDGGTSVSSITNTKLEYDEETGNATITADVTGDDVGNAVIELTVSSMEGLGPEDNKVLAKKATATFNLNVTPIPVTSIKLTAPAITYYKGDTINLDTTTAVGISISPTNAGILTDNTKMLWSDRVVWSSSNTTVASISADNKTLTFNATGSAIISAKLKSVANENDKVPIATMTITCAGTNPATSSGITRPPVTNPAQPPAGGGSTTQTGTNTANVGVNTAMFSSNLVIPVSSDTTLNTSLENVPNDLYETGLIMAVSSTVAASEQKDSTGAVKASAQAQQKARAVKPLTKGANSNTAVSTISTRLTANVVKGQIIQLMPVVTPVIADTSKITWTSSDPTIATVDENGIVTGITAGKYVKITAKAANGRSAVTTVTVINPPGTQLSGIKMNKSELGMGISNISTLTVSYTPTTSPVRGLTWYTSDPTVASVDQNGRVTAIGKGEAVITAVSDDGGKTASCKVTVSAKLTSIKVSKSTLKISVGSKEQLGYTITPIEASDAIVTWKSGNTKIATVSSTGEITGVKTGQVYITVSAGGKSSTCLVTIVK